MKLLAEMNNMRFKDYVPTADEIDADITEVKAQIRQAKIGKKTPLIAKYELHLRQLQSKKEKLAK